jgi:hypothetical protein
VNSLRFRNPTSLPFIPVATEYYPLEHPELENRGQTPVRKLFPNFSRSLGSIALVPTLYMMGGDADLRRGSLQTTTLRAMCACLTGLSRYRTVIILLDAPPPGCQCQGTYPMATARDPRWHYVTQSLYHEVVNAKSAGHDI